MNPEKAAALKAFVDQWAPPDLEAFRRTAQGFLDAERARQDAGKTETSLDLEDLWEVLTEDC